jgi:bifunctional UDP-N-acetylglucosamine pyrophosphorylase/glucosamine-1-phosphate N-acetyltransferase/UDP-N-acetylglucosamine pyrophosphorylase
MPPRFAVVLAAGKGTRMKTELPKVLVPVLGRAMIQYVIDALEAAGILRVFVVVGYRADDVRRELAGRRGVEFVDQSEQLGTGHAVMVCREKLAAHQGPVLVVTGDSPLIQVDSIRALFQEYDARQPACLLGTAHRTNPQGLGRIVRDEQGDFLKIVEEKDASAEEQRITEVNMSTYVFRTPDLLAALAKIRCDNVQREYYITDCPGVLKKEGRDVRALPVLKPCEALSVNTVEDLAVVEAAMRELLG